MLVLGIDPGSRKMGYALVEAKGRSLLYVDSGIVKYDHIHLFLDRLGEVYTSCEKLVKQYGPQEIALESLIYVKSVTALAKLAQARGAMVAAFLATHRGCIFEYSPNLVKSSVTGHGHASKESVEKTLQMIFPRNLEFKGHDESDALAVAVCHALRRDARLQDVSIQKEGGFV